MSGERFLIKLEVIDTLSDERQPSGARMPIAYASSPVSGPPVSEAEMRRVVDRLVESLYGGPIGDE